MKNISTEEGITFKSYKDGKTFRVSPEFSIQTQAKLGADIILVLDELVSFNNTSFENTNKSLERSNIWAERSLKEHLRIGVRGQALYGIMHGGFYPELRQKSAEFLAERPFDGFAIGGSLGTGPNNIEAREALKIGLDYLPTDKPRHLLGIGDLPSLASAVHLGIDTFDSSFPTKLGRHGTVLIDEKTPYLYIGKSIHSRTFSRPIDITCSCPICKQYSLAYLHHLFKAHEPIVSTFLSAHNLYATHRLMSTIRNRILDGDL